MVTDKFSVRDDSTLQRVANAMRQEECAAATASANSSVSSFIGTSSPYPTMTNFRAMLRDGAVFIYTFPKAFCERLAVLPTSKNSVVVFEETLGLSFDMSKSGIGARSVFGKLAAATFAEVCAKLSLHRKPPFVATPTDAETSRGYLSRFIITPASGGA